MKFFSPEVCTGDGDFESYVASYTAYRQHIESLRGRLPNRVLELAEPSGMEDGLIVCVDHNHSTRILRFVLRCGDLQMGYYNLDLRYLDAEILPEHDVLLAKLARSTKNQRYHGGDLVAHELDLSEDGKIAHRFLFYDNVAGERCAWFELKCRNLRWRRVQRKSRRLPPMADRYPAGPAT